MNFNGNQSKFKNAIRQNFLTFFKTQDVKHLATQKLKERRKMLRELVREYDERFKDLLIHILYRIEEQLQVQWFVAGLLQNIRASLIMHEITTYEEVLHKSQQVEFDDDYYMSMIDFKLEDT